MAGVNNVSTYDNAPENSNNTLEHTNKAADDSDDKDDSLQNVINSELSKRLMNECSDEVTTDHVDPVKSAVDLMLSAESIHSASVERQSCDDVAEYSDLKSLHSSSDKFQIQKDLSELMVLTEQQHTENTSDTGLDSEFVSELDPLKSDYIDSSLSDCNTSSGFVNDETKELLFTGDDQDVPKQLDEPRVFTRPLPVDELDNVTELVFDTWTTIGDVLQGSEALKVDTNGTGHELTTSTNSDTISTTAASPNQECFDINTPAITNSVVSFTV